jgi:hypothetical protein
VIVNEGEHYDPYDGVFVAPQKGVYLFSWTVSGGGAKYIVTELVVERNIKKKTFDFSVGINSLTILGHIINEKSKER